MKDKQANCATFHGDEASGNIFIRKISLEKKGDLVDGHEHSFDHTTIFLTGSFHVKITNPACKQDCPDRVRELDIEAPAHLLIKANLEHEITATSDDGGNFWCVYSHRAMDGQVIQDTTPNPEMAKAYDVLCEIETASPDSGIDIAPVLPALKKAVKSFIPNTSKSYV